MKTELRQKFRAALASDAQRASFIDRHGSLSRSDVLSKIDLLSVEIASKFPMAARIGVCYPNSSALAIAILACLMTGRTPVLHHHYLKGVAQDDSFVDGWIIPAAGDEVKDTIIVFDLHCELRGGVRSAPPPSPEHLVAPFRFVLFTSGSSGRPRGVEIGSQPLEYLAELTLARFRLGETSAAAIALPLSHVTALLTQFFPTLLAGGVCHFFDLVANAGLYSAILRSGATFVTLVPSSLVLCEREKNLAQLRLAEAVVDVSLSGETVSSGRRLLARELFPNAKIHVSYGLTEAPRITSIDSDAPAFWTTCAGLANPHMQIKICDENEAPLGPNQTGMICIEGPTVAEGYCGEKLRRNGDGFLITGDIGHLDESNALFVDGRADGSFKIGGRQFSPSEIELVCMELEFVTEVKCIKNEKENGSLEAVLFLATAALSKYSFAEIFLLSP
jgi:acyl-CoA synthetase (AMP-forming)/AMP-acid ligase II